MVELAFRLASTDGLKKDRELAGYRGPSTPDRKKRDPPLRMTLVGLLLSAKC